MWSDEIGQYVYAIVLHYSLCAGITDGQLRQRGAAGGLEVAHLILLPPRLRERGGEGREGEGRGGEGGGRRDIV